MVTRGVSYRQRYLYFLVHLKGLLRGGFSKKHFGQWAEDVIVSGLLSDTERGFYVDVGAYHPFHYSNTCLLYKRGWHGINIDPNPDAIRLFDLHRRRDINVQAGVAEEDTARTYFMFDHQSCNTFSVEQKNTMLKKKFIHLIGQQDVRCRPLSDVLHEHALGVRIDFLNVDVEGMGLAVLKSLDFSRWSPRCICIEDDSFDVEGSHIRSELHAYMGEQGYELRSRVGLSSIYMKRSV